MSQLPELLPCPFCGNEAKHSVWSVNDYHNIECEECDFGFDYNATFIEAAERWNIRAIASVKREPLSELIALALAYRDARQKVDALPEDAYLHGGIDRLTSAIAERDGAAFQLFAFAEQLGQVDKSQGRVDNAMLQVDKPVENSVLVDSELVTTAQQSQWLPMESAPKDGKNG